MLAQHVHRSPPDNFQASNDAQLLSLREGDGFVCMCVCVCFHHSLCVPNAPSSPRPQEGINPPWRVEGGRERTLRLFLGRASVGHMFMSMSVTLDGPVTLTAVSGIVFIGIVPPHLCLLAASVNILYIL